MQDRDQDQVRGARWPWAKATLFQGLGDADLDAIATRLGVRQFAPGDVLIQQGIWSGQLFILRGGVVQISVVAESEHHDAERTVPLRRLVSGECFGEMSLITGAAPSATAQALTEGEAWMLSQQDFLQLAMAHPRFSHNINGILSERLLHTSRLQAAEAPPQTIVVVGDYAGAWRGIAAQVARFSRQPTLLIDGSGQGASSPSLADLLGGGITVPAPGQAQVVAATPAQADAADLPGVLRQLGGDYRYSIDRKSVV